ncbi:glucose-6-phosphate 1-dehydrogenase [Sporolactobacillus inulinus]|uniref:Glucose-6-phosphate 1-dehydrogenase n=1 Tax=Sporolactobacillus inulinus TaxID=2078 RepID=A0A4Y1ZAF7_9BACL|nr:glucose-6-phosphate 1-dehydrogenase [Sporolactobacillus inulinus]
MIESSKEPVLIFLFGATGDLARRKLYSALYRLYKRDQEFAVIGLARRAHTDETYRDLINDSLPSEVGQRQHFLERFYYRRLDITRPENFATLKEFSDELNERYQLKGNRIFYLSLAPAYFAEAAKKFEKIRTSNHFRLETVSYREAVWARSEILKRIKRKLAPCLL